MIPQAALPDSNAKSSPECANLNSLCAESARTNLANNIPNLSTTQDEANFIVHGVYYTKLGCVGKGGSSKVYKVMAPNKKIYLKEHDSQANRGNIEEINLLQSLKGKDNIIQLIDAEVLTDKNVTYMVLEYGETDFSWLLTKQRTQKREEALEEFDENFVRLYWQQILKAVH